MRHFIFDWGDTVMRDDQTRTDAMYLWPTVELIADAQEVLRVLSQVACVSLATSAAQSDEWMIRKALARVQVDQYFRFVFSARTFGKKKDEPDFWLHLLRALDARPDDVTVVGDNFTSDVSTPATVGMRGVWLNQRTKEDRRGDRYHTIHSLSELIPHRAPNKAIEPTPVLGCKQPSTGVVHL